MKEDDYANYMLEMLITYISELGYMPDKPYRNNKLDKYICRPCFDSERREYGRFWTIILDSKIGTTCIYCHKYLKSRELIRAIADELENITDLPDKVRLTHLGNILKHVEITLRGKICGGVDIQAIRRLICVVRKNDVPWELFV